MREIWKSIPGYPAYCVSTIGRVKRCATPAKRGTGNGAKPERLLVARSNNKGYSVVSLWKENKRKDFLVHRLVAIAFVENPMSFPVVHHKDENPSNNRADNLVWCTQKYNMNCGNAPIKIAKANALPVLQIEKSGAIVRQHCSIIQAQRDTGISQGSIGDCLHGRRKTAGGYLWRYAK